ncbi:MAG: PSD1 domain-containing protein [Candidatus Hydrogenedentes bacterium]|nr:PSD1 domain-containing protein [Candidatus Hydrogenedentota bacterium]
MLSGIPCLSRLLCLAAFGVIVSCGAALAQELPPAANRPVDFDTEIHPLLAERCFQCHGGGQSRGGLQMDSRELLLNGGDSGPVVVEGKSGESRLISLVAGLDPELIMPPKGPQLTPEEVGILRAWIDQGLVWHETKTEAAAYVASVTPRRPELPAAKEGASANPIDRFLDAYYALHSVTPSASVSDAVFLRRASLDVTGLVPQPADLDAFLADTDPEKYAKAADRLLGDRLAYAEHWMTFWNDALRNDFQGTGYIDGGRKQITQWLFDALYNNLPYDQFASQLINPSAESEGFVNGIIWRGVTAAAMVPPMQAAQSVSQVFLGVNLKCASCHDSFVDHWKLADSYGMASVFSDGAMELVRCDVPQGETAQIKFLWPEVGRVDPKRSLAGRRAQLARLLTSEENGFFARAIVNRIWAKFMGRGLVEPLDVIENEPWNADLLDWLASDLVDHGYDLKHTMKLILTSQAYRLPSVDTPPDSQNAYVFRGPEVKRMTAEMFLDTLSSLTGAWQENPQFAVPEPPKKKDEQPKPPVIRAWRVNSDPLTRAMGRPNREQVVTRRQSLATALEAVELTNGQTLSSHLQRGAESLLAAPPASPEDLVSSIYRHALQRDVTESEKAAAAQMVGSPVTKEGFEDFLWALAMQPEFQLIY